MGASIPERVSTNEADIECDVVVVGAGFGGLYALHKLREIGFSVRGLEAAPDVGGTWYWNRYPGARCDVPSLFYSYSWSPELRREWRWTNRYAGQEEILSYARFAADRLDLRKLIQFDTRVAGATFDETSERWIVETDRGEPPARPLRHHGDRRPVGAQHARHSRRRRLQGRASTTPPAGRRSRSTSRASGSASSAPAPPASRRSR